MTSDRQRLVAAFSALRRNGYVADGPLGDTPTDGWTEVYERSGTDDGPAVFFTSETGRAFRGDRLTRKLALQWRGDARVIVEAFGKHGFTASIPDTDREAITIVAGAATKWAYGRVKAKPAKATSELAGELAKLEAALAVLASKDYKIVWKPKNRYYEGSPPARTISVAAGSLTALPTQLKRQARGFAQPTYSVSLYARKPELAALRSALRKVGLSAKRSGLSDCGLDVSLPAP